ncbi:substrate-binding periplasmic protein [Shewanella aestuarii]|nr:transporter substrate-binding domain-containing protein [Shewanella aestuarii]
MPLILVAADSAPTAYMDNGQVKGILVDIVTEAFKRAGYTVNIQLKPWARCLNEVQNGTVDGIFSVFKLPERDAYLTYTDSPIISQVESFFVRADSTITFDGDLTKFEDVEIGVIRNTSYGSSIDEMINNKIWKQVTKTNNIDSLVAMLVGERFDLVPSYHHVFLHAAKRLGVSDKIKELTPIVYELPSYLAFSNKRDYSAIVVDFDKALAQMKSDGTFDAIYDKYL